MTSTRRKKGTLVLAVVVLMLGATVATAVQVDEDPLERRTLDIAKDLRCAVCQNQPVSESNSDLARDMRVIIREQLSAGKAPDEIKQYFVDRYGDYVLMKPPAEGAGLLLWVLPLFVVVAIALGAGLYLKHRHRPALAPPPALSDEDRRRVAQARREGA